MKVGIQAVLWILCVFFAYKIYDSINGPIAFNNIKTERYAKVIAKLKDIGNAQAAHKDILGYYSCLLYTSPSPRDLSTSRMPSSA